VNSFATGREAKEFLIAKIVEEASLEGVSLSEIERKMLYFTETAWTLPDIMQVNDEFDRDYDQGKYEKKIARLIKNAGRRARKNSREDYATFLSAIRRLKREDHYILVMVQQAGLRPPGDRLKLWGTGFGIVALFVFLIMLAIKYNLDLDRYIGRDGLLYYWLYAMVLGAALAYGLLRWTLGGEKTDKLTAKVIERLFRGH